MGRSLLISEDVLEGTGSLRDSSRNQGAGNCHLPLLLPSITHSHLLEPAKWYSLLNLLTPSPASSSPACLSPCFASPLPQKTSTNLANNIIKAFFRAWFPGSTSGSRPYETLRHTLLKFHIPPTLWALWICPVGPVLPLRPVSFDKQTEGCLVKTACSSPTGDETLPTIGKECFCRHLD